MTKEAAQRAVELTAKIKELEREREDLIAERHFLSLCNRGTDYYLATNCVSYPNFRVQLVKTAYKAMMDALVAMIKETEAELERL